MDFVKGDPIARLEPGRISAGSEQRLLFAAVLVALGSVFLQTPVAARSYGLAEYGTPMLPRDGEFVSDLSLAAMYLTSAGMTYALEGGTLFTPIKRLALGVSAPFYRAEDTQVTAVGDITLHLRFALVLTRLARLTLAADLELPSGDKRLFRYYAFKGTSVCINQQHRYDAGTLDFAPALLGSFSFPAATSVLYNLGYEFTGDCKCFPGVLGTYDDRVTYAVAVLNEALLDQRLTLLMGMLGQWQGRWGERHELAPVVAYEYAEGRSFRGALNLSLQDDYLRYYHWRLSLGFEVMW